MDPEYARLLGQAIYSFAYLEWGVIWTIAKLRSDYFNEIAAKKAEKKPKTAVAHRNDLWAAIAKASPPLSTDLKKDLVAFAQRYADLIKHRNQLLHAHPFTAQGGEQRLGGGPEWTPDAIIAVSKEFEEAAIQGNGIFHGLLAKERP